MQLRDFGRLASGNSRILVYFRSRVLKLTKALKPEKSAQKRVQVSAQASDIRIFALTASTTTSIAVVLNGTDESDDVPVRDTQLEQLSSLRLVQLASGSNEPGEGGGGAQQDFGVSVRVSS